MYEASWRSKNITTFSFGKYSVTNKLIRKVLFNQVYF